MTISYNLDVSSMSFKNFFKLLFRWKGSIWKFVIFELIVWLIGYYIIFFAYRYGMDAKQKDVFERICAQISHEQSYIPLTFMLGFFVTIIIDRWRKIFDNMGWIENAAISAATLLHADGEEANLARRTIIRYMVLSQVLSFRNISMKVRRRFPTMQSIIRAGFMFEHELKALEEVDIPYNKYWVPIEWAVNIAYDLHKKDNTPPASFNNTFIEIKNFRTNLQTLTNYDWVPIPLAYPQVVFFAVRCYFVVCLLSRQILISPDTSYQTIVDMRVPFMTIIEFICIVGWMKVAESLLNPLGEDDDDFECNFLLDKNIATGMAIVDARTDYPDLVPDKFRDPIYRAKYKDYDHGRKIIMGSAEEVELDSETSSQGSGSNQQEQRKETLTRRIKRKLCCISEEEIMQKEMRAETVASRGPNEISIAAFKDMYENGPPEAPRAGHVNFAMSP